MKQRPILIAVIGYTIGILVGLYLQISIVPFYILIAVIYYIYKFYKRRYITKKFRKLKLLSIKRYIRYIKLHFNSSVILILVISSIISNSIEIFQNYNYQTMYFKLSEEENIKLEGIILSSKESKKYYDRYIFETNYKNNKIKLYIHTKNIDLEYGEKVSLNGKYKKPEVQRNYKGFDYSEYLKQLKIYGTIQVENIKRISKNNSNKIFYFSNKISSIFEEKVQRNMPNKYSSILLGLILGKTDNMDKMIKENFRNANMSHILAVSGMHVTYLLMGINIALKKVIGKKLTNIISILFLIFYMCITNFSPSITRAGIMGILLLISKLVYRKNDIFTSISFSLLFILVQNPYSINNPGLQLSFGGVVGIIFFNEVILDLLKNIKCKKIIAISLSVQIFIFPIVLLQFNTFSPYFLISNLLLSIVIGPIVILGFIYIILIMINENLAFLLTNLVQFGIKLLLNISQLGMLPYSKIYLRTPKIYEILIYYFLIFSIKEIYKIYHKKRINQTQKRIKNLIALLKYKFNQNRQKYLIIFFIISLLMSYVILIPNTLKIYFVDVGQGDSTFIVTPKNQTILIDGGGSDFSDFNVGEKTLLPYILDRGFTKIDYIIISHFDSDHCLGLLYLMQEIKINNVIIGTQYESSKNYEKFLEIAKHKKVNLKYVEAGNRINIEKNLYFDIFWPCSDSMISENAINNNSLVCKLIYKDFSMLFTGDIEKIAEKSILDKYKKDLNILKSNVLKIAHHGSKTSSTNEFIKAVKPKYTLIGVGNDNKFGHPSDSTIKTLKIENIRIYRTDKMGEIIIETNGKKIKIKNKLMYKNFKYCK